MSLDAQIENILKTINTEVKIIIQLLLDPMGGGVHGNSGPELADIMRHQAEGSWSLDNGTVIKICKRLSDQGALAYLLNEQRTLARPAKYYFVTNNGSENIYRALAALALRTITDNEVSFYNIFGSYGGTKIRKEKSNLASKGLVFTFKTLLHFYGMDELLDSSCSIKEIEPINRNYSSIERFAGTTDTTAINIVQRLVEAGLVNITSVPSEYVYNVEIPLGGVDSRRDLKSFIDDIDYVLNLDFKDKGFTMNQLFEALRRHEKVYKKDRLINALTRLHQEGYLSRKGGPNEISLNKLGVAVTKQFVIPMYGLLNDTETKEGIYKLAGFKLPKEIPDGAIRSALSLYSSLEKHTKS